MLDGHRRGLADGRSCRRRQTGPSGSVDVDVRRGQDAASASASGELQDVLGRLADRLAGLDLLLGLLGLLRPSTCRHTPSGEGQADRDRSGAHGHRGGVLGCGSSRAGHYGPAGTPPAIELFRGVPVPAADLADEVVAGQVEVERGDGDVALAEARDVGLGALRGGRGGCRSSSSRSGRGGPAGARSPRRSGRCPSARRGPPWARPASGRAG